MFRNDSGELAAIIDWELATIGDPLLDLGALIASWPDEEGATPLGQAPAAMAGAPSRAELVAQHLAGPGGDHPPRLTLRGAAHHARFGPV